MAKAQEIAVGMESAANQNNELQVSSKGLGLNIVTVDMLSRCGKSSWVKMAFYGGLTPKHLDALVLTPFELSCINGLSSKFYADMVEC